MKSLFHDGEFYNIRVEALEKHKKLITLVLNTESMNYNEKQYWFDILLTMTKEQVERLVEILESEKNKLEELERNYQEDLQALLKKHLEEWIAYRIKISKS